MSMSAPDPANNVHVFGKGYGQMVNGKFVPAYQIGVPLKTVKEDTYKKEDLAHLQRQLEQIMIDNGLGKYLNSGNDLYEEELKVRAETEDEIHRRRLETVLNEPFTLPDYIKTVNESRNVDPISGSMPWGTEPYKYGLKSQSLVTSESQYLDALRQVLEKGVQKGDRTGTGTISKFGLDMRFDLSKGFPLLTTKKVHWKSVVHELLWFISGSTNIKYLQDNGVRIWDEWADEFGDLGPVYGRQWRAWDAGKEYSGKTGDHERILIDQLQNAIETIKTNPDSRRIIVSAWNVGQADQMALPPCHLLFQFYVEPLREGEDKRRLSCKLTQRSADMFLGVPFNIASYALLVHMAAKVCNLDVGDFIWSGGDCHIYNNHIEQVKTQLDRTPRPLPTLRLNPAIKNIDDFTFEDIELDGYDPHPAIKGKVSV